MKNYALLFIAIFSVFSISCFAQHSELQTNAKMGNTQSRSGNLSGDNDVAVVSYHVEERINMAFGSRITTYDVSTLSMVNTYDLGQNNIRIVTPKFAKIRPALAVSNEQPKPPAEVISTPIPIKVEIPTIPAPVKVEAVATEERSKYAYIDILRTYERIIDRGYKNRRNAFKSR